MFFLKGLVHPHCMSKVREGCLIIHCNLVVIFGRTRNFKMELFVLSSTNEIAFTSIVLSWREKSQLDICKPGQIKPALTGQIAWEKMCLCNLGELAIWNAKHKLLTLDGTNHNLFIVLPHYEGFAKNLCCVWNHLRHTTNKQWPVWPWLAGWLTSYPCRSLWSFSTLATWEHFSRFVVHFAAFWANQYALLAYLAFWIQPVWQFVSKITKVDMAIPSLLS